MRQKRLRSEPVPELFPLTGEKLSENVFEILIDLFASSEKEHCEDSRVSVGSEHFEDSRVSVGSEHFEDSRVSAGSEQCEGSHVSAGSEQCEGSRVPGDHVYTQDRDRFRPLKRRVEVSMRNLSREGRDAY